MYNENLLKCPGYLKKYVKDYKEFMVNITCKKRIIITDLTDIGCQWPKSKENLMYLTL